MSDGILVIDKPEGLTSHDVIARLRRATGIKRIGHSGTLDPMATGVLPVFFGKATRIIEYLSPPTDDGAKVYECVMQLGFEYDTLDITGKRTAVYEGDFPTDAEIVRTLLANVGEGEQYPPAYSAVKVAGVQLYKYAREGRAIPEEKIKPRPIKIKAIEDIAIERGDAAPRVRFTLTCSKGVYVRVLCSDVGKSLGTGAAMSALRRRASDGFHIASAVALEVIDSAEKAESLMRPADSALGRLASCRLDREDAQRFSNGLSRLLARVALPEATEGKPTEGQRLLIYTEAGAFVGIGEIRGNQLRPVKVIFPVSK